MPNLEINNDHEDAGQWLNHYPKLHARSLMGKPPVFQRDRADPCCTYFVDDPVGQTTSC